jgi:hypothetical protein
MCLVIDLRSRGDRVGKRQQHHHGRFFARLTNGLLAVLLTKNREIVVLKKTHETKQNLLVQTHSLILLPSQSIKT